MRKSPKSPRWRRGRCVYRRDRLEIELGRVSIPRVSRSPPRISPQLAAYVHYITQLYVQAATKKGFVGIHSSGFKDFLLKPELLRAIQDCGFEHPSEVQVRVRWRLMSSIRLVARVPSAITHNLHTSLPAARVHPAGDSRHGRHLPGQVWNGKDGRVCHFHAAAAGARGWPGGCPHPVPYP